MRRSDAPTECRLGRVQTLQSKDYDQGRPVSVNGLKVTDECQQLNANNPSCVSAETETLANAFYRNRKQAENSFSIGFGAETETET